MVKWGTLKSGVASASGSTAIWTPASTNYVRIAAARFLVSGDAYAAADELTLALYDAATATPLSLIIGIPIAAPSAVTRGALWDSGWIDLGLGIRTAAVGDAVNINLSEALTAGKCSVLLMGNEGPWV